MGKLLTFLLVGGFRAGFCNLTASPLGAKIPLMFSRIPFPMTHMLSQSFCRTVTRPCHFPGWLDRRATDTHTPGGLIAGLSCLPRPTDRRQIFLEVVGRASCSHRHQDTPSFPVLRVPASCGCGSSGFGSADRQQPCRGCRARADLRHLALLAGVSTVPPTTPSLFAPGLRPSRTKTVSAQARTLRLSS